MSGKGRRKALKIVGALLGIVCLLVVGWAFPTVRDIYKSGILSVLPGDRKYNGNTILDLRAIRTAVMEYHESEGQFPPAANWMEAIKDHIRTSDMSAEEAAKKFVDPAFAGQPGKYGFALNDAIAGKYKGDIKDPKTPLIFECADPARNAHGDPTKNAPKPAHAGGNLAISIDGTILKLTD